MPPINGEGEYGKALELQSGFRKKTERNKCQLCWTDNLSQSRIMGKSRDYGFSAPYIEGSPWREGRSWAISWIHRSHRLAEV
ncbi:hypothetical protein GCM10007094_38780 [Pseudovibrio japonicus]|uniref:Uncharacterized protein n=1 Tax=Pseudovibrio japonicus TaxID=366534 RepID=A0ABQ3ELK9_9HYPH|nr:hypothetical protein GCM10007094_38780 [Pseudovibrio japonicus]